MNEPTTTPTMTGTAQAFSTSMSTAPLARCAWNERMEVGMMMASEVPTDSGNKHWVARCPDCKTAMWNEHGTRKAITRYVRVDTLDAPEACPPLAHIFTRSKQPWLALPEGSKQYPAYYDASKAWPKASLERYAAAKAARAQERVNERTQRASRKSGQSSKAE